MRPYVSPNLACWCFQSCTCPGLSSRDDEPRNQWSDRWLGPLYPPGLSWLCHPCTPWLCVAAHPTLSSTCNWGQKNTDVPDRAQSLTFYLFATRSIQPATMLHDRCSFSPHPLAGSRASERGLSSDRGLSRSLQTRTCLCWPSSLATSMRLVPVSAQ